MNLKSLILNLKSKRGYTLLFAVLTATLVLGVAVFILSVSKRQLELSVAARDSTYSIYAADSGIECAAAAAEAGRLATSSNAEIYCKGAPYSAAWTQTNPDSSFWSNTPQSPYVTASMNMALGNGTCAEVVVINGYINQNGTFPNIMTIQSRGYNYCDASTNTHIASRRTVERALRLVYQ
ncbi:MAG: hypothetical protein RL536_71 [Candidatus Parcubacteria bacterium]|jgi:hypothetical protein